MNSRQRIDALLRGRLPDRIGKAEAPWPETRARWAREGLPPGVHANDHFGMDIRHLLRTDCSFRLPEEVVEDAAEFQIVRTADGGLTKCWKHTGVPQPLSFGLTGPADWRRLRERLVATPERLSFGYYGDYGHEYTAGDFAAVQAAYDACPTRETTFVPLAVADPYEAFLGKMGDEALLLTMVGEPDFARELFAAHADFVIALMDLAVEKGLQPDCLWIGGDLAYKNGMLFSPATYRAVLGPFHQRIIDHAHRVHGLPVVYHTDGDCREAIPLLLEAGIDCLQPLEARAGLDVRDLAGRYGDRLAFMGNISVENLGRGGPALRQEIEDKCRAVTAGGIRYIFHSDHSLPDSCSLATFTEAMELVDRHGRY